MNQLDVESQKITRACDEAEMRGLCGESWIKGSFMLCPDRVCSTVSFIIRSRPVGCLTRRHGRPPNEGLWMRPRGTLAGWDESGSPDGAMTLLARRPATCRFRG